MTLWIVFLAYIEAFGAGVAIFAKRRGRKEWAYYFIPFYAFTFANKTTKGFKVMSIPVENLFKSVLVETAVCILAFIYAHVEVKLFPANQRSCVNNMLRG